MCWNMRLSSVWCVWLPPASSAWASCCCCFLRSGTPSLCASSPPSQTRSLRSMARSWPSPASTRAAAAEPMAQSQSLWHDPMILHCPVPSPTPILTRFYMSHLGSVARWLWCWLTDQEVQNQENRMCNSHWEKLSQFCHFPQELLGSENRTFTAEFGEQKVGKCYLLSWIPCHAQFCPSHAPRPVFLNFGPPIPPQYIFLLWPRTSTSNHLALAKLYQLFLSEATTKICAVGGTEGPELGNTSLDHVSSTLNLLHGLYSVNINMEWASLAQSYMYLLNLLRGVSIEYLHLTSYIVLYTGMGWETYAEHTGSFSFLIKVK